MVGCCKFQHNAAQEICNLYDRCTDMVTPMNHVVGWKTYSPQPQPWGKLRQAWCKVGGLVPEQYVGQHLKRLQNLTFSSAAYGLVRCQRACQVYVGCNSITWSPTCCGGDCFLYPKRVPLPARYSVAYDYHSCYTSGKPCTSMTSVLSGTWRFAQVRLRIWLGVFPRGSAPNQQFQLAPSNGLRIAAACSSEPALVWTQ